MSPLKHAGRSQSGAFPAFLGHGFVPGELPIVLSSRVEATITILWEYLQQAGTIHCFTGVVINNSGAGEAADSSSRLNVKLDLLSPLPSVHNSSHLPKLCEK